MTDHHPSSLELEEAARVKPCPVCGVVGSLRLSYQLMRTISLMTEPQRDVKSGLPMPDPATFPDGGPDPLVEPEHRPDSEWTDGEQPVDSVGEPNKPT